MTEKSSANFKAQGDTLEGTEHCSRSPARRRPLLLSLCSVRTSVGHGEGCFTLCVHGARDRQGRKGVLPPFTDEDTEARALDRALPPTAASSSRLTDSPHGTRHSP